MKKGNKESTVDKSGIFAMKSLAKNDFICSSKNLFITYKEVCNKA